MSRVFNFLKAKKSNTAVMTYEEKKEFERYLVLNMANKDEDCRLEMNDRILMAIKKGYSVNDFVFGERKEALLDLAAFYGNTEVFLLLRANGANVNNVDYYGYTPLHKACKLYNIDGNGDYSSIIHYLIEDGVDINAVSKENCTPLDELLSKTDGYSGDILKKTHDEICFIEETLKSAGAFRFSEINRE